MTHVIYLHGFGSGPGSRRNRHLQDRLGSRCRSWSVPALDGGDFCRLTMDGIFDRSEGALAAVPAEDGPVLLIGSSLGGYVAASLASRAPDRIAALVLIAPAFGFTDRLSGILTEEEIARWRRDGSYPFYHHESENELPLWAGFMDSCEELPPLPAAAPQPTCILHGRDDETIAIDWSRRYAAGQPQVELIEVAGDHQLAEEHHQEELVRLVARQLDRLAADAGSRFRS